MKLAIILNGNDPETAWNALRLGNTALDAGHDVSVFLMGSGVEIEDMLTYLHVESFVQPVVILAQAGIQKSCLIISLDSRFRRMRLLIQACVKRKAS